MSESKKITKTQKDVDLVKTEVGGATLFISTARPKIRKSRFEEKYDTEKYDISSGYTCPDFALELIPGNTPEYVEHGENYVQRIVRALSYFKQCALVGPSGTGKTHIVYLVAELASLPIWEINCGLQTSTYDLFGRYIGLGRENWVDGQIVSWARYGGILYLDEANMMKQDVAARLNPVLDTRGHVVLAEKDNEIVPRHSMGYVILSMNPYSSEFAGTKPLNAAFRRRMTTWINFEYLSLGSKISREEALLISGRAGIPGEISIKVVKVAAELRRQYKCGDLPYAPSVGDLINWSRLISDGISPLKSAEEAIIAMTSDDPEIQENVRRVVAMYLG
jgi:MoxR-like ATPase